MIHLQTGIYDYKGWTLERQGSGWYVYEPCMFANGKYVQNLQDAKLEVRICKLQEYAARLPM